MIPPLRNPRWRVGLLLLLLSYGCATAYREDSANEMPAESALTEADLNDQLTADRLSPAQLQAFELRAQQKLRDFFDYLTLVGDPSLDSTFRAEAAKQATDLFVNPQAVVRIVATEQPAKDRAIGPWLEALAQSDEAVTFLSGEPALSRPLTLGDSLQYRGELLMTLPSDGDAESEARTYQVSVLVKRVAKDFGEDEMQVWEVFLKGVW